MASDRESWPGGTVRAAIVVLDFNGLEDSRRCLASIERSERGGILVLFVDNGSHPPTAPSIGAEFPWVRVIRREENGGWAGGNNAGLKAALEAGAPHVILLNNDTVVAPQLVPRLLAAAASRPDCGILGPIINYLDEPDVVMTDGVVFNAPGAPGEFFGRRVVNIVRAVAPRVEEVDIVNGCALMISAEAVARIGLIDERFFLIHEESDLCLRTLAAGMRCGVVAEPLVWHKGSSAFKRTGSRYQRYYDSRNLILLLRKHARTHQRGRSLARSWFEYARYVYYRWSIEREAGEADAADAVIEGILDGLASRHGAYVKATPRSGKAALTVALEVVHRLKSGRFRRPKLGGAT